MTRKTKSAVRNNKGENTRDKSQSKAQGKVDTKSMLKALRTTTAIGAVSLTLAGWGVLSRAEATNAAQAALAVPVTNDASFASGSLALAPATMPPAVQPTQTATADSTATGAPTASPPTATTIIPSTDKGASLPTPTTTPTTEPSATPTQAPSAVKNTIRLNIVQWLQTTSGDKVAVVRDARGTLWYVWENDVTRIEQGLSPQHQPIPVNQRGRTRGS